MATINIIMPMTSNIEHADENEAQVINIDYRTITGNTVNFRKGPSTSYSSLAKLNKGYSVEYLGMSGSWGNVKYNGQIGYVHSDYVSRDQAKYGQYVNRNELKKGDLIFFDTDGSNNGYVNAIRVL